MSHSFVSLAPAMLEGVLSNLWSAGYVTDCQDQYCNSTTVRTGVRSTSIKKSDNATRPLFVY